MAQLNRGKKAPGDAANVFIRVILSDASSILGGLTEEQWEETLAFFGHRCAYSGTPFKKGSIKIEHGHPIPQNREWCGLHLYGNVVPATPDAIQLKGGKHYAEFLGDGGVRNLKRKQRIDQFLRESGYLGKVKMLGDLRKYCEAQYRAATALCNVNRDYLNSLLSQQKNKARPPKAAVPTSQRPTDLIEYEENYRQYLAEVHELEEKTIGGYVSSLKTVARTIRKPITPKLLHSDKALQAVAQRLTNSGKLGEGTIKNCKTKMRHYAQMVKHYRLG